jgi:hypothetical protein
MVWALSVAAPAVAEDMVIESFELGDAEALVTACTVPADHPLYQTAKGFCLGYMTGAMQLYDAATASPSVEDFVCPGRVVSRAEMRDVFLEWAAANPQQLDEPAIDSLVRSAVAKFPCSSWETEHDLDWQASRRPRARRFSARRLRRQRWAWCGHRRRRGCGGQRYRRRDPWRQRDGERCGRRRLGSGCGRRRRLRRQPFLIPGFV